MIEKQPQIRCSTQAALNAATSGPSSVHMSSGAVFIDRPCSAYSGNTTRSIVGMVAARLADHRADALGLRRELRRRLDDRQLQLHQADDDAVRRLVETTESAHASDSSYFDRRQLARAAARDAAAAEQVMTRITSVST